MSQFLFFAALLALLAVAFAVSALWRSSRTLALTLALMLPAAAAGLYYLKGNPAALEPQVAAAPSSIEEAVAQLQARLASQPENFEGLGLLARSYMAMEKYDLARDAYAKALKLRPDDIDLSVEYAESLLRTSPDRRFPPEAVLLLENAVARHPDNQRALFFLGTHQMQDNRPAEAVATWEKLLPQLDAATAGALRKQVDAARLAAGMPPLPPEAAPTPDTETAALTIDVQIDPTLARLAQPGDVLYVFARPLDGKGPPFAAKRVELGSLPLRLQLTDADSPMPAAKLFSQDKVLLMARLSKSGDVKAASGDIETDPLQVSTQGKEQITLVLKRSVP